MSKPFVVSIPHGLGKDEATRRIREGLASAREKFGSFVAIGDAAWDGDQMSLRVGALGQTANGTIKVSESDATVTVELPWLLARFADKAQAVLQQQGHLLLDKK